uniref:Uncharacterized protein n=1 Tax=viral metagenome TaxID=1070528 RepID=A0A6H2A5Z9_9ZZZZ
MANSGTVILRCYCKNSFQDRKYGQGNRLHNHCNNPVTKEPMRGARCTVCASEKSL